jgi:DNA-binding SARP family transcriptional activator
LHVALSQFGVALVALLGTPGSFDSKAVEAALQSVRSIGESMGSDILLFMYRLLAAHAVLASARPGAREGGLADLREAMAIGRRRGYVNTYWWMPSVMAQLCAHALANDIEADYVVDLIRRRSLSPPAVALNLERWPWPLRVRTFGALTIFKDGVELSTGAQGQKKPVELLQAIIALGGKDVSEAKLCDTLWPDAEAGRARSNLKVALHRLRKLITVDVIEMREGRLSLDVTRCQVDARALEHVVRAIGGTLASMSVADIFHASEQLFALYRGPFLANESASVVIGTRERLRSIVLRATTALAERCVHLGAQAEARVLYERLLDIEPLAESAYLSLMRIHLALRRPADGLATYERCRRILRSLLQIAPSSETEALAASLRTLSA